MWILVVLVFEKYLRRLEYLVTYVYTQLQWYYCYKFFIKVQLSIGIQLSSFLIGDFIYSINRKFSLTSNKCEITFTEISGNIFKWIEKIPFKLLTIGY